MTCTGSNNGCLNTGDAENLISPSGWIPQQPQYDTEGLEDSWTATGLQSSWEAKEAGF